MSAPAAAADAPEAPENNNDPDVVVEGAKARDEEDSHRIELDEKQKTAVAILAKAAGAAFSKPYVGDLFGSRTDSVEGMLYLSRIKVKDQLKNNVPTPLHAAPVDSALPKHADSPAQHMNEVGYRTKKRQCAKTFERMIYSRLAPSSTTSSDALLSGHPTAARDKGIKALLDNGIVQALVSLAAVPDAQTQAHCAKAFYGLAQVPCTRRLLVLNGIVGTIAQLVRHGDNAAHGSARAKLKQDLAAILCHITEESFLEDKMLHDGVDRTLAKLYHGHSVETKRVVALAFFNLSHNAGQLKHYVDVFTQCLTGVCKTVNAAQHPTKATLLLVQALFNLAQNHAFHNVLMAENAHRVMSTPLAHYAKHHHRKGKRVDAVEEAAVDYGLKGLFMLSLVKNGRQHIVQDSLVAPIVACLSFGTIADTVCSILFQLSLDETCRDSMVHEISVVVDSIQQCSAYGYFAVSWVFRNLCATKAIYPALVEAGVVRLLMQMSRDTHDEIKLNGISCMCCLLQCDVQLADAVACMQRIMLDLVQLLQSPTDSIVVFAITALFNLSCNDALHSFLADTATGVVPALQTLLAKPLNDKTTAALLPLVFQLSHESRIAMLRAGFFDFVAAAITATTGAARHAALDTMLHFMLEPDEFPQGTDEVKALLKALYTLKTNSDPVALRSCVSLLAHLTTMPRNRDLLLRTGCALCLARICNTADDYVMGNCAYILFCLTETLDAVEIIVREDAIPVLIQLSRASSDLVKELCIRSFCRISTHANMETKLVEQGAIAASMIMALVATKSDTIKTLCVKIISNCLCLQAKHCTRTMVDHGVFWALSSLASLPFADTKHACATCFCNLSTAYPLKMVEAGVPRALVQLVETGDGPTIVVALEAIANLLQNDKACTILVNEGLVKILRRLVQDTNASVAHAAAMVMLKTSRADDKCRVESLRNDLLPWMLTILADAALATQALITLCDCSATPAAKTHVEPTAAMAVLRAAVDLDATDRRRLRFCVQTLYNLTCQRASLLDLVRAHAHVFLQDVLPTDDAALAHLCVVSLYNLTCVDDESALSSLVTSGLTRVLHRVYLADAASTTASWCVHSICNLALGKVNSSRIVTELGGVVLVDYVQAATTLDDATVSAAFRKLINPPGNQKAMVELGVVRALVRLLRHPTAAASTRLHCLDSLAILTRNKENILRSLGDGILACTLDVVDANEARQPTPDVAVGALCFTILSNLCSVDYDAVTPVAQDSHHATRTHANVIAYLTQLSEYNAAKDGPDVAPPPPPHVGKAQVQARYLAVVPHGVASVSPTYTVSWEKCYADNRPVLPAPVANVWSPVNISVFTKNLPDSFRLPRFEILEKEPLVRDLNDSSEAAHRYVVGIKGLVRLQVARSQVTMGMRRKKTQATSAAALETSVEGDEASGSGRPRSGKMRKESSVGKHPIQLSPLGSMRMKRSSSLKLVNN
ncbi:Aste57867_13593 [Aphanomyces stellatus]|uniref:Aste57867_13593 protein n=1 Tax=Aphanomyces stellatus TaxID=120398 RepID=A0A485KZE1_9STRA|nr:hypothetical protein As57867_013543 [Aphanomyces stellatus]VFT90430.1 Aste57867_13593 [Aphanomyces stellatus]